MGKDGRVTARCTDVNHFAAEHRNAFRRVSYSACPPETLACLQGVGLESVRSKHEYLRLTG